jgi:Undecaprenyl-phosphate glucose phosphotransferase
MLKRYSQLFEGLFTASDLLVVSLAWVLSYWIRFNTGLIEIDKGVPPFSDYVRMLIFVWLIWAFVFRRFRLYKPKRGTNRLSEIFTVVKANAYAVVILLAVTYLFREKSVPFSRAVFVIFWGLSTVFTVASRSLIRLLLRYLRRRGYNLRYALLVGSGALAGQVARRIINHPEYGIELVGCLGNVDRKAPHINTNGSNVKFHHAVSGAVNGATAYNISLKPIINSYLPKAVPVIGDYEDLPRILKENKGIDQIIVALPLCDHHKLESVISSVGDEMIDIRLVPDFHEFIQLGNEVEEFDGLPVMSVASTPLSGINRVLKRALDIILGVMFLIISLPLMIITALLIKLTSRGPVFFTQERVGLDGRSFNIFKFRTMEMNAEENGAQFAVKGDPRVTQIGKVLRKLSIDELPQLVNVILGHMSLVGPRPERPVFIQEFRRQLPRYMLRHKVQAGITGWAQVNGWRGNTSIEKRIEYDLYYIENWSLGLDLKIIGMTLLHSFRDRNAY